VPSKNAILQLLTTYTDTESVTDRRMHMNRL